MLQSIIASFVGICDFPPVNILFHVFSRSVHAYRLKHYPHGAVPRSRRQEIFERYFLLLFPALQQHLWDSVRSHKKFFAIVLESVNKSRFISCFDKAASSSMTNSLNNRAVSGPGFISQKKYPGLRPHGFLFLAAKTREGTYSAVKRRRKEEVRSRK
jgi:hypothetical protein